MNTIREHFSRSLEAFAIFRFNLALTHPCYKKITDFVANLFRRKEEPTIPTPPLVACKAPPTPRIQQVVSPIFHPERVAVLGAGAFGVVSKVQGIAPNTFLALKELIKQPDNKKAEKAEKELYNEVRLLNQIHEHTIAPGIQLPPHRIVKLEPTTLHPPARAISQTTGVGYLAPLYTGGDLNQCVNYTAEMPRQLIAGLKILHLKGIVHGDITPENIFIMDGEKRRYDLADFGKACILDEMRPEFDRLRSSTSDYAAAARELRGLYNSTYLAEADKVAETSALQNNNFEAWKHARQKADLFALGCTLIQRLAPESLPFWGISPEDQAAFIRGCSRIGLTTSERALILRLADQDPNKRVL